MAPSALKMTLEEVKKLVSSEESTSNIKKTEGLITLSLHPIYAANISKGVSDELNSMSSQYSKELGGIPIAYEKVRISPNGGLLHASPYIYFRVQATFYIFSPEVGSILEGTVKKKSLHHLSCLVHRLFNVSVPRPQHIAVKDWQGNSLDERDVIKISVTNIDMSFHLPMITGSIESVVSKAVPEVIEDMSAVDDEIFEDEDFAKYLTENTSLDSGISGSEEEEEENEATPDSDTSGSEEEEEESEATADSSEEEEEKIEVTADSDASGSEEESEATADSSEEEEEKIEVTADSDASGSEEESEATADSSEEEEEEMEVTADSKTNGSKEESEATADSSEEEEMEVTADNNTSGSEEESEATADSSEEEEEEIEVTTKEKVKRGKEVQNVNFLAKKKSGKDKSIKKKDKEVGKKKTKGLEEKKKNKEVGKKKKIVLEEKKKVKEVGKKKSKGLEDGVGDIKKKKKNIDTPSVKKKKKNKKDDDSGDEVEYMKADKKEKGKKMKLKKKSLEKIDSSSFQLANGELSEDKTAKKLSRRDGAKKESVDITSINKKIKKTKVAIKKKRDKNEEVLREVFDGKELEYSTAQLSNEATESRKSKKRKLEATPENHRKKRKLAKH